MGYPVTTIEIINYVDGKKIAELKLSTLPPINTYFYIEHLKQYYQVKSYFLKTETTKKEGLYKEGAYKMIAIQTKIRDGLEDICNNI